MQLHGENTSSLTECFKEVSMPFFPSISKLLTASYSILLANYDDEDEISILHVHNINGNSKQVTMKININFEETASSFLAKILNNAFIVKKEPYENLNSIIIFSDGANKNNILSYPNQNKDNLEAELIFLINTHTYEQKILYDSRKYSEKNIIALNGHIKKIISVLIQKPNIPLKDLVILTQEEWNKIILEWNTTEAYYPKDKSIPELFTEIVRKHASSTALTYKDKKITYAELDDLSSNLARYLIRYASLGKKKIVAIYMERSLESFISVLGILKAGLAYLPVHLHFPPERIQMILEDAEVVTLITQKKLLNTLKSVKNINIIPIETILEKYLTGPEYLERILSHDLAYIIYTSGTTGKPKGTKISHKGVANLVTHVRKDFSVVHQTKVLQFASLSFDASVYEWAGALLNGAELCILAEDELPPKADLSAIMREKKINFALLPPPILESMDHSNLNELHTLVSGGEACTQNIANKWANGRKLFNAYGPSEATVACSFSRCYPHKRITIGKPIQNVKLYVLNKYRQPVPVGVSGELYIGGVGLAQGYLNRTELTKKAFLTNPFSANKADRLYKTGDRVRWLENGELEYIDRIDSQVKLEGYRIELGEIESVLNQFPEIESSSIIIYKIDDVHKQLIAFFILKRGIKELNKEHLKTFLNKKLPKYMIPANYIKLDNFPLTLTNKVDRKALLKIYEESKNKHSYSTNQKGLISLLEQTWQELLNCDDINGNFFSLGGDSIRAIQFVAILRKYGYIISSKVLYDHPTIAELAEVLKNEVKPYKVSNQSSLIAPQGEVELSPIQHWFFEHQFKDYNQWNQAFLFRTKSSINKEYFRKAWELLIKHHDTFRLRYKLNGNKVKQYYEECELACSFIFKEFNLSKSTSPDSEWITTQCISLQNSLDIEKGPILSIGIFNHQNGQQRILIAIHHLLVDGISWRILLEDFFDIYGQLSRSEEVKLLPKSDHYGTWVKALQSYATKENTKSQIPYWQSLSQKIKNSENSKRNLIKDQQHYMLKFSKEITLELLQDLPSHYPLHVNDILLSGLAFALYKEDKNYEFLIDMEGHGREECIEGVDVTRAIGWFTTIFPVLLEIPKAFLESDNSTWSELIRTIKQELRQIPDKGIGYGILRYLADEATKRQLSNASAPILFNYLGHFDLVSKNQKAWSFALESPGNPIGTDYFGKENYSRYPLEINAVTFQNSLYINFNYNKYIHSEEKIKRLASYYELALKKLVMLGKKLAFENLYVASDSPAAKLTYDKYNNLHNSIEHDAYVPFSLINVLEYKNIISDISIIEDIYPASYLQRRMLQEAALDDRGTYHIVSNYSIHAKYDKNKLFSIIEQLVNKHELLRAGFFLNKEGEYSVVVFKSAQIEYQFYENQDSKELIAKERLNKFNYSKPGLLRLLINKKGDHFDLIFSFHNALEDGWSMATLVNEFGQAYMNDKPIEQNLKLKYGEFVRNEIAAIKNQDNINFWKGYLEGSNAIKVNWKSDKEKSENSLYHSIFTLNSDQVFLIHNISKEARIGVESIFLLTYLKTLAYFTNKSDIIVGIAANNRLEKESGEKLFGLYINIIPFRFNLNRGSNAFEQVLEIFKNKIKLQKYKNLPYNHIKSLFKNEELYEFVFDFVHLHLLNERVKGIESTDGYERTHIPFTLTVAQKGEEAFALGVTAHDDFINKEFLSELTTYFKNCLIETSDLIQREMNQKLCPLAVNQ